ncbi:MAG: hypothetical protein A2Y10_05985 [Planctomycetes bacterium GWF2_41_51]|nr:MAG: hypothetical protein A2Y10_05985 [Planctomycetes bacterium GWF2_41_51]
MLLAHYKEISVCYLFFPLNAIFPNLLDFSPLRVAFAKNVKGGKIRDAMKKTNSYKQEIELIEELIAVIDSAKVKLVSMLYSKLINEPTAEQLELMNLLYIPYTSAISRKQAQQLIDTRCQRIFASILADITAKNSQNLHIEITERRCRS